MKAGQKRLAVFDLDGTLVDSREAISDAVTIAWRALGLEPPAYEQSRQIVGLSLNEALQTLAPGLPQDRLRDLSRAYQNAFIDKRRRGLSEPLYDGALALLQSMKGAGWDLGVATGKSRRGIDHVFSHHGIGDLFSAAFCADDGPGKPDPHMLRLNMDALGFRPAETVMIGDTSFDMSMARAANCYALGVTWGFHTKDEICDGGAHDVVDAFHDLAARLGQWRGET